MVSKFNPLIWRLIFTKYIVERAWKKKLKWYVKKQVKRGGENKCEERIKDESNNMYKFKKILKAREEIYEDWDNEIDTKLNLGYAVLVVSNMIKAIFEHFQWLEKPHDGLTHGRTKPLIKFQNF